MPLVTLSAPYGAGGSQVGPALADRLGVRFLDRALPREVADRLAVPVADAERHDESPGSALGRVLRDIAPLGVAFGGGPVVVDDDGYRSATEEIICQHAAGDGAVILGRGAAIVLRDEPGALHVRLDAPRERRIEQAMEIEGVDHDTAAARQVHTDRARESYVRHFYRCDPADPKHYHLIVDSTRLPLDRVVDLIAAAARTPAASATA
jgi:cytidylate kinase